MSVKNLMEMSYVRVIIYLTTIHTALLVASNAAGAKMIELPGGFAASAAVFSYMITFVILDIVTELFGKKVAKMVISVGLLALMISVLFFQVAILAPAATFWDQQAAYEATLGSSWRILLGGWLAYLVGQNLDVWLFVKLRESKILGSSLWVRAIASTAIGQFIDTCIFIAIAFYGAFPLLPAIAGQYMIKLILAAISVPLVTLGVRVGQKYLSEAETDKSPANRPFAG